MSNVEECKKKKTPPRIRQTRTHGFCKIREGEHPDFRATPIKSEFGIVGISNQVCRATPTKSEIRIVGIELTRCSL